MYVLVDTIDYTAGSTMGTATGFEVDMDITDSGNSTVPTSTGRRVVFGVDHRPLRSMSEALAEALSEEEDGLVCEIEAWQILGIKPKKIDPAL